jgi:hypothetical protein
LVFRKLGVLGCELISLHLLQSTKLEKTRAKFIGRSNEVSKIGWTADGGGTVWIDAGGTKNATKPGTSGFRPVSEEIWNFHIGGYQVCEKWLKERKGRILSADDIDLYNKIVVAISETIRLMPEIDRVIDEHGGWPGAFVTEPLESIDEPPEESELSPDESREAQSTFL